jgi:hypothetical protein
MNKFRFNLTGTQQVKCQDAIRHIVAHVKEPNGERVSLVREAQNQYDASAISVTWNGAHLGYIPKIICDCCSSPITPSIVKCKRCAGAGVIYLSAFLSEMIDQGVPVEGTIIWATAYQSKTPGIGIEVIYGNKHPGNEDTEDPTDNQQPQE